ncbi:MAG: hypothetical protein WB562_16745 [Candidatus Sulfotelmatobacter sp.]
MKVVVCFLSELFLYLCFIFLNLPVEDFGMAVESGAGAGVGGKKIWVTLSGLPLTIGLEWPFHKSTSGADFWVLHGDIGLENGEGLHAAVSVNLSATVREVLPSLEAKDVEAPVINALRKEVDRRQIEFVKSGKLLPVAFSSRHYDFKRGQWVFGKATDEVVATFLARKIYWQTKLGGKDPLLPERLVDGSQSPLLAKDARNGAPGLDGTRVWIADPTEAQYLETTTEHLVEIAGTVPVGDGLVRVEGQWAEAAPRLMERAAEFEGAMRAAADELEKKHAFERG